MNKLFKVIISILGAINVVFSIFIPIAVALLSIKFFGFQGIWSNILLVAGILSSIYKGINVGFIK
jgi:hypothetical protein